LCRLLALAALLAWTLCGSAAAQVPGGSFSVEQVPAGQPLSGRPSTGQPFAGQLPAGQLPAEKSPAFQPNSNQPSFDPPLFVPPLNNAAPSQPAGEQTPVGGPGLMFRVDHIEGDGVPQVDSITPLQLFPYVMVDNSLFFSDLRFYSTNDLMVGGNAGLGYRYYSPWLDRVFGISGWYDGDNTRDLYFQQVGLSLETYAWLLDLRANFYLPVGETERTSLEFINGSTHFSGDGLYYNMLRSTYLAMKGADYELGVPLPTRFAKQHGIRIYGGGYLYEDDARNEIHGWSGRIQGNLFAGLDAQVQVTHDDFFDTRAFAGVSWTFGRLHRSQLSQETALGRIGEHVTRNYTVLAPLRQYNEQVRAVDAATGDPYTFAHVASAAAAGGSGSVDSPFQSLSEAQAANPDIIFVHAGSVFAGGGAVALTAGQRLLGDSDQAQHFVLVPEFGALLLPHGPTGGVRPTISGSLGDAVALASQAEISNFSILSAAANGIVGNGVQGAVIRNVSINGTGQDGVRLVDSSGLVSISNLAVANTGGRGIALEGGLATFNLGGTTALAHTGGAALSIQDLASTAAVNLDNLAIIQRQARGLEIDNVSGAVNIAGQATVANELHSTESAVDIRNSSGQFAINRLDITGATGAAGMNLENNTGKTSLGTLNIASQNGTALRAVGGGTLVINKAVDDKVDLTRGGTITAVNGTALDIANTALDLNLTSVSSSNATRGISLVNTTGQTVILGNTETPGSAGTISGADTGIFVQNAGLTAFQFMKLEGNDVGVYSENSAELVVLGSSITGSTSYGIDSLNTAKMRIATTHFSGNGGTNIRGQVDHLGTYAYTLLNNSLESTTADNVVLTSLPSGVGSSLTMISQGVVYQNSLAGSTGLKIDWNGVLAAGIDDSTFFTAGGSNTGIDIRNASVAGTSAIALTASGFYGVGGHDTAVRLAAAGPSQIDLNNNTLELRAIQGTGYDLSLGTSSNVSITGNYIYDIIDGSTGVLFNSVAGPANVKIETNLINLKNQGGLEDRGIVFQNVHNTVTLSGAVDNTINNATTPFSMPAGVSKGSILVNGVHLP
jgi:hypothetical protein